MRNWKAIVAMGENRVIGINNTLPWDIPEEKEWFRTKTSKQLLVLGRKTFESIRFRNPESQYLVLSKNEKNSDYDSNVQFINNIDKLDSINTNKEVWICGGEEIYRQTLTNCSELYLTTIKKSFDGDCYFPDYKEDFIFNEIIFENEYFIIEKYINKNGVNSVEFNN
ncbi:dihydrofolate reductase [Bacillus sp. SH8-8]|uniref:dihydrofolate reductase n=1 Tax=Bacillus sp. SH8-8 TaxID=2217830 RepID=UPI0034D580A0